MDLCLTFYLYFILHLCVPSAETFVTLDCNASVTGILHEDTILPCKTDTTDPVDIRFIKLHQNQTRNKKLISTSSENVRRGQDRIQLRCQDELRCQHDLSLIIHKTELSDNGTYQYALYATHGHASALITLIVEGSGYSNTAALEKSKDRERTGVGLILSVVFLMLLIFSAMFYYKKRSSRASMRRFSETSRSNLIAN
ncbi:uncharacterized protein LOC129708458 isoform X2 [Leucoraja erinacea]|uniref:uncharacterized protein LOC129708458 isoform X2 n=1 Tax=Leucoraja erinaceus TaxID=7782 RepID=UPI002453F76A|nr:uncharacterized protein LOC129708458 isoform X2 [Leucoraja erinacea]